MFTGIIQATGIIKEQKKTTDSYQLLVESDNFFKNCHIGDSIAVNGVCLTIAQLPSFSSALFSLSSETLRCTHFSEASSDHFVNLETSLTYQEKMHGHLVQGHIDGVGKITSIDPQEYGCYKLTIEVSPKIHAYLVEKGSIALDGISLTINTVSFPEFSCMIIPHTWENTNLKQKKQGALVNIEVDMLCKYIKKLTQPYREKNL